MSNLIYSIKSKFLTVFGDIKVYPFPMFMVYSPKSFRIKGDQTRTIMKLIHPGDIVMRSYVNYIDGYFIPTGESGCSHSGICVDGNHVIHAMAEGIVEHDIIDFCRCDKIMVLRPKAGVDFAIKHARKSLGEHIPYDFDFKDGNKSYYCHEFTASCFPMLDLQRISREAFGFISSPKVYLADSFYTSPDFTITYK